LGLKDLEEAEIRSCLADVFYKALDVITWRHQFSPLYERVAGEKIKIKRKFEKKEPAYKLAFSVGESEFIEAWVGLWKEGKLPITLHYKGITIGALGWLKAVEERDFINGSYSKVFNILEEKFDENSANTIIFNFLNVIEQIGKEPEKFELTKEEGDKVFRCLEKISSEKDAEKRQAMIYQLIHTYLSDDNLLYIINNLIAVELIKPPKVRWPYERYPYSFSNWIITPYGLIKQAHSWERKPIEALSGFIKKELKREDIEPELEKYHGDYELKIIEYCIKENPEEIMKRLFGMPQLRRIAKELGIMSSDKIKSDGELIQLILLKLGFSLPPTITGLKDYQKFLSECRKKLYKDEPLSGIITDVYRETQNVLRDITYFYIRFLWQQEDVNEIIREKIGLQDYKPFDKLGLGHFINLIRVLNSKIQKDKALKKKMSDNFGRNNVLSKEDIGILDEISPVLSVSGRHEKVDKKECFCVLDKLQSLSESLEKKETYPRTIRIMHEVTNEYGVGYFEAIDDRGDVWTIEKRWLDPSKPYFMHSKTYPVAIDPIIIEKIF